MHSLALDKEAGSYPAEPVADNIWGENTISSANNPEGSVVPGTWSPGDDIEIDVTAIIDDGLASDAKLSIRIVSTLNNGTTPVYGSREHPKELARPRLIVHYE